MVVHAIVVGDGELVLGDDLTGAIVQLTGQFEAFGRDYAGLVVQQSGRQGQCIVGDDAPALVVDSIGAERELAAGNVAGLVGELARDV